MVATPQRQVCHRRNVVVDTPEILKKEKILVALTQESVSCRFISLLIFSEPSTHPSTGERALSMS